MVTIWVYTLISILVVSLLSLLGALGLLVKEIWLRKTVFLLVSIAVGALFGDVFVHILPEIYGSMSVSAVALLILLGILIFFVLEKFLHWKHDHIEDCDECTDKHAVEPVGYMTLASDTVHNFIDGLIIGSSFLVSREVGIATTLAVILHEIPQEISHFGILIHAGFSKLKALGVNFLSALSAFLGGICALLVGTGSSHLILYILPITAGGFIYIAGSDLVPELHKTKNFWKSTIQLCAIVGGFLIMVLLLAFE